ncbi:protein of unknown function (DUF2431) [Fragilaria crotonensis]|nr:protein of unknown function (DUF2431) [Fragilaria crotonensis]
MILTSKGNPCNHGVQTVLQELTSCFLSRWLSPKVYHTSCQRIQSLKCRRILVCGDGNLSFSASLAESLDRKDKDGLCGLDGLDTQLPIHLTATVLETKAEHTKVYADSQFNINLIESLGHKVRFQVDATKLNDYFHHQEFDQIHFNFPHCKGKSNIRYNRLLIQEFFNAASAVLTPRGRIHMALMESQGGMSSTTIRAWKQSWIPAVCAANSGFLLINVEPVCYRFRDDQFHLQRPHMYTFVRPDAFVSVPENLQLYCHFEILIDTVQPDVLVLLEDVVNELMQSTGWKVKIFFFRQQSVTTRSYKIAIFGEQVPITREKADAVRLRIIHELVRRCDNSNFPFLSASRSRTISNPCPTSILSGFMENPGAESCAVFDQGDDTSSH